MKKDNFNCFSLLLSFSTYQIKDNYILNSKFKIDQILLKIIIFLRMKNKK